MNARHRLIVGTVVIAVLAGAGAAVAALELTASSSPETIPLASGPAPFGDGFGDAGLGGGRLGGRGLGGGLGPGSGRFGVGFHGGGFGRGFGRRRLLGAGFGAAATYLGVSGSALGSDLAGGKTLAQVAQGEGKPVDGLVAAIVAAERKALATAVSSGYLTQAQAQSIESTMSAHASAIVDGTLPGGGFRGGFGGFGGRGPGSPGPTA